MMEVVEQGDEEEEGDSSGEEDEAEDIRQMVLQQNRKKKKSGGFQSMGELVSYRLILLDVIVGGVSCKTCRAQKPSGEFVVMLYCYVFMTV